MTIHDYDITNADGATVRADINAVLAAIVSNNSNATAPTTTFAYMWWFDTATATLKQRNSGNTGWVSLWKLSTSGWQVLLTKGSDVASAATLTLGSDGNYFDITGTTTITAIASIAVGMVVKLHFDGALTLTHDATDLILPGGANINVVAGDEFEFVEYASGDWRCTGYTLANGGSISRGGSPVGQCRLAKNGANIELTPFDGNEMLDGAGNVLIVPASTTLAATGLTIDTDHFIYAYASSGSTVNTLEASTTGYTTTNGIKHKTGNTERVLVGMARPITGPVWVDSATQRFVLSYFNRQAITAKNAYTASRSTTSTTWAQVNSEIQIEFLTWGDIDALLFGQCVNASTGLQIGNGIALDGTTTPTTLTGRVQAPAAARGHGFTARLSDPVSEGYHFLAHVAVVDGGTASWVFNTYDSQSATTYLTAIVEG